jgi:hypothetical protein
VNCISMVVSVLILLITVGEWQRPPSQPAFLRLPPVDEAKTDPTLLDFRNRLAAALKSGDVGSVLSFMEKNVRLEIEPHWRRIPANRLVIDSDSEWVALRRLLALGGSFTTTRGAVAGRQEFCAPYVYSAFPARPLPESIEGEVDPWVILGEKVPVYSERKATARVMLYLSYAIVRTGGGLLGPERDGTFWAPLHLPDDREGFVISEQIRSPSDYHACFAKLDGAWRMTAFERNVNPQ